MSTPKYNNFGVYHYEHGPVVVCGRFTCAGAAMGAYFGHGFVPTRTGVGDYLLTFTDGFSHFLGGAISANDSAITGVQAKFGTFTAGVAGACTLQILTSEDTAAATVWQAVEVVAGEYVSFVVFLHTEFEP